MVKKNKFKIGDSVWYISDGYIANRVVKGVFIDKWGLTEYSFANATYEDGRHQFFDHMVEDEVNLFPSKEALIKSIQESQE